MKDEEVGKVWASCYKSTRHNKDKTIVKIIRELVEERAWHYTIPITIQREGKPTKNSILQALRDFHIDPKTWKE